MNLATGEIAPLNIGVGGLEVPHNHSPNSYPNGHASIALVRYGLRSLGELDSQVTNEALSVLYGLGYAVKFSGSLEVGGVVQQVDVDTRPHVSRRHKRWLSRRLGVELTPIDINPPMH